MFAVSNTYETIGCSDGSLHSINGMRVIFLPVAVNVEYNTVSVYPRVERQCAHSILWFVLDNGTGTGTFLLIPISLCPMKPKTSRPPLSSATVRRPVAATWPHPLLINTPLITFPRIIRVLKLSQSAIPTPVPCKALGRSREGNRLFPPSEQSVPPKGTARARHPADPQSCLQPSPSTCCATILTPGSPSEASVCTPAASASCRRPAATACSTRVSSTSTGSSTPWALPASMGSSSRPCRSVVATCRAYTSASSASAPGVRPGTVSDIPVPGCPSGLPLQKIDCNTVFICIIYWLIGAPSPPPRQLSDPAASTMRRVAVRVSLTHYQPGLIK